MEKYYQDLLASETKSGNNTEENSSLSDSDSKSSTTDSVCVPEKWKGQIEKVTADAMFAVLMLRVFSLWVLLSFSWYCTFKFSNFDIGYECRICLERSQVILL